ncbi:hypothetical protein LDENG_00251930 [Lucifuga dentata]|nr:hypothetical protein LDENG_00251930 [Lucifuga dentata]
MAEARTEEEEENMRETREQVVRRQPGRSERRKPEHRHSQGPLSSIRAAIKRTSTRTTSLSETPRERERERDRRRPEITILSAEPLASTSWFPGASGGFPPPPPAAQIWGPTIPPAVQPPPSYEEVIREKTQEQVLLPPSSCSSSSPQSVSTTTIATQTDPGYSSPDTRDPQGRRPVRPPRPPLPNTPRPSHTDDITITTSQSTLTSFDGDGVKPNTHPETVTHTATHTQCCDLLTDFFSPLTSTSVAQTDQRDTSSNLPPPLLERPRPRPRSKVNIKPVGCEVKIQTLVKLREDCLSTLAARAGSDAADREASQGSYLQELLEAFSSDDWGFPDHYSNGSGVSQSEDEEGDEEEEVTGEEMATLKARIQAFEQQQETDGRIVEEFVVTKRPEPQPRPRLQGQPAKPAPPTVAPKPKAFTQTPKPSNKRFWEDGGLTAADSGNVDVPKTAKTPSADPEPAAAPRASAGASPQDRSAAAGHAAPALPPRASMEVSRAGSNETAAETEARAVTVETPDAADQTAKSANRRPSIPTKPPAVTSSCRASAPNLASKPTRASPTSPEPNPVPPKPAASASTPPLKLAPAPALRKSSVVQAKPETAGAANPNSSDPPLPPQSSGVKPLPLRPPPIKSTPGRPPPPAINSTSSSAANQTSFPSKSSSTLSVSPANQTSPLQTGPAPPSVTINQTQGHRASKRGPPLPPRPKPGHPLYTYVKQEVLIVLDDPSPTPSEPPFNDGKDQTTYTPVINQSQCPRVLDAQPLPVPDLDNQSKPALEGLSLSESQSILPTEQKEQPEPDPVSGPRCVALFDYEGEEEDELTFSQGDVIALHELIGPEWGRGQIHGRIGIFPLNFADIVEPLPVPAVSPGETTKTAPTKQDSEMEEWAVALFDFPGQTAEDLSFHKGALIRVMEHIDTEWRRGNVEGREGLYPAAFTQSCQGQPIPEQQPAVQSVATALFDFTPESEDELTLKVGDMITQVEVVDERWIMGVVGGKRGIAPKNYISLL